MERTTYTPQEAADIMGVGRDAMYELLHAGAVPAIRVGRRWVIPREVFHRWLDEAGERRDAFSLTA